MTHLCVFIFLLVCGMFGFVFESISAPAVCVWIGFIIVAAAEISIHWEHFK